MNDVAEETNNNQSTKVQSIEDISSSQPVSKEESNSTVFVMIGIAIILAIIIIVVAILLKKRKKTNKDKAQTVKESEADEEVPSPAKDVPTYAD